MWSLLSTVLYSALFVMLKCFAWIQVSAKLKKNPIKLNQVIVKVMVSFVSSARNNETCCWKNILMYVGEKLEFL